MGVRGARVSLGADGKVRSSVGIPGTGISYRQTLGHARSARPTSSGSGCLSIFAALPLVGVVVYGAAAALDRFGATVSLSALALIIGGTIGILVMKGRRGTSKLGSNTCKVS